MKKTVQKRPAHEVILEMLGEIVDAINHRQKGDILGNATKTGALAITLETLKRMIIPEENHVEMANALSRLKAKVGRLGPLDNDFPDTKEEWLEIISSPTALKSSLL